MASGLGFYHLCGDAKTIAVFTQASFEQVAYPELATHAFHVYSLFLVGEARIARDYEQAFDARQSSDDVFDHAVGEILLLGVAAQI